MPTELISSDYAIWLTELKTRIQSARSRAALSVNSEVVRLYHSIGRDILERQTQQGWGSKVIPRIAADLKDAFSGYQGLLCQQHQIHALLRGALSGSRYCAAAW